MLLPARIFIYGRGNSIGWFKKIVTTIGDNNNKIIEINNNPVQNVGTYFPITCERRCPT